MKERQTWNRKSGLTLTELMVASIILSIVMLGIVAIDYALRSSRESASADATLAMQTSATMLHIARNAKQAFGDATNLGILSGAAQGLADTICFRNIEVGNDIPNYNNDQWTCYTRNNNNINFCTFNNPPQVCAAGAAGLISGPTFLGTVANDGATYHFEYDFTLATGFVDLKIRNRYPNPNQPFNVNSNPEYRLESRVRPDGQGL